MERAQNLREIKLDKSRKKKKNAEDPTIYLHKEP